MNKKIIGTTLCVCILIVSAIPAMGINVGIKRDLELNDVKDFVDPTGNYTFGNFSLRTVGPVSKKYVNAEVTDGPARIVKIINRNLDRKLLRLSWLLPFLFIPVNGINFTVQYIKDSSNESKYIYMTNLSEVVYDENGSIAGYVNGSTIYNEVHNITVENFQGFFIFYRAKIYSREMPKGKRWFNPPFFLFAGFSDKATIS